MSALQIVLVSVLGGLVYSYGIIYTHRSLLGHWAYRDYLNAIDKSIIEYDFNPDNYGDTDRYVGSFIFCLFLLPIALLTVFGYRKIGSYAIEPKEARAKRSAKEQKEKIKELERELEQLSA